MQSVSKLLTALGAVALAAGACWPAPPAVAAPVLAESMPRCGTSLTGKISQVFGPTEFAMIVDNRRVGSIHVRDSGARINARGLSVRAGTYAAVYGCFGPQQRYFSANEVTLATSRSSYGSTAMASPSPRIQVGPCQVSLFGTIAQVWNNGVEFTLQTTGPIGSIHVYDNEATMHLSGLSIANGTYAGVYGCFLNHQQRFHANEVTLATSAAAYPGRPHVVATGVIDDVARGWIGVRTRYYGHVHVLTAQTGFSRGQRVSIEGRYNTITRQIDATRVTVIS
ncbi:MAG: hypothetical protein ABR508_04055 [Candidatus Baltobacteraceae bacterium]